MCRDQFGSRSSLGNLERADADSNSTDDSSSAENGNVRERNGSRVTNGKKLSTSSISRRKNANFQFKYSHHVGESHKQPIFGIAFNSYLEISHDRRVFAVTGSSRVSVYECMKDGHLQLLQSFDDPDKEEIFYCCVWTYDDVSSESILVTGGARGIVRIINPARVTYKQLKGHGLSINDLKIHPRSPSLLLSVSKDHSLRLWNIKTHTCIAIFGGVEGHRDEVLSADFHKQGNRIISCGMDHALKIWSLDSKIVADAIENSHTYNSSKSPTEFQTARVDFPAFTTRDIHRNYVDCVSWLGNFVLSKSCENKIVLWKPGKLDSEWEDLLPESGVISDAKTTPIHNFELANSEIWFMRFSLDRNQTTIALGNMIGKTYIWDIDEDDPDDFR